MSSPESKAEIGYITGTGQFLRNTHTVAQCSPHPCVIHRPSHHHMEHWPTHWREDRGFMERICSHGVGHPDPDHLAHIRRTQGDTAALYESVHGCDGCCRAH